MRFPSGWCDPRDRHLSDAPACDRKREGRVTALVERGGHLLLWDDADNLGRRISRFVNAAHTRNGVSRHNGASRHNGNGNGHAHHAARA